MINLLRSTRKGFAVLALSMAIGTVPARSSELLEPLPSPQEQKVLEEYRLNCRPGRFKENVKENLEIMQAAHPGSNILTDTAFLAEVHYLDWGFLWNGNGKKPPGMVYYEMFDTLFNDYAPSRNAWSRSRNYENKAAGFAALGVLFAVTHVYLGLYSLFNEPPRGRGSLAVYRSAQIGLPIGWICSFLYSGINTAKHNREFDKAFYEANGKVIAKRLANGS